jgi:hypothetical protein
MKTLISATLLIIIIGSVQALDTESYEYIDRLLNIETPGPPEIFEDAVIFTASSSYKKVGIAFAHESFSRIYWFKKLLTPIETTEAFDPASKITPERYHDSGVLFYTYTIPENIAELEYRLVINGLWTTDPRNPARRINRASGIEMSVVAIPAIERVHSVSGGAAGTVSFHYKAPPGETITVAGDFNNWDPFMYELAEKSPGDYYLTLPLPAGSYRYAYYHRGLRLLDPFNTNKVYYAGDKTASEVTLK